MKILIVDDELTSKSKLEVILKQFGACDTVEDGKKALDAFKKAIREGHPYDLITLDLEMPQIDGLETLNQIRDLENKIFLNEQSRTKIIIITSHASEADVLNCLRKGCNDYIVKPFRNETVLSKVIQLKLKDSLSKKKN